jgi:hypothetical protein
MNSYNTPDLIPCETKLKATFTDLYLTFIYDSYKVKYGKENTSGSTEGNDTDLTLFNQFVIQLRLIFLKTKMFY